MRDGAAIGFRTVPPGGNRPFLWQRLLAALLVSLNCLLLAGCQFPAHPEGPLTLTLWHGINPPENREVFQELLDRFNQTHRDVQVEAFYVGQSDQQIPKILTAIVGEQPPDLLWQVPQLTGPLVDLEAIIPLEGWLDRSPLKAQIVPSLFESMELNGHLYSVPFATNNAAIFYRPSLFQQAGIEGVPKTWADFRGVAEKLTQDLDGDGRTDRYGLLLSLGKGEWTVFVWLPFIYSAGGELIAPDGRPNLVHPGTREALQWGADLVEEGVAILSPPERGYELDNFLAGKVAMQVTGPWTLGQLQQTQVDYGVFPLPILKQPAAVIGGENLYVFKTTPARQQASLTFLEYVLSEEFQTTWALKTGYLPINLKAQNSDAYQAFVAENPVLQVFLAQMQWARSRPIIPGYTHLSENLGRAIETVLLGKEPPQAALQQAQERLESILNGR